jgi:hypothetical protein|tara:strand:+ start:10052 stop:10672 length:621 start_codon:yes stop_codon:yes gene_type:complete
MSKLTDAREYVGGLSNPSKMPCKAYSIPAQECKVGSKLRLVAGSVCSACYALKGRYTFPNVENALYRRFATLDRQYWVENMAVAINGAEFFRWHDSGDIQNLKHLCRICAVCELTPDTRHWLPTREVAIVREYLKANPSGFPENLIVRVSANMVDARTPNFAHTSTVDTRDRVAGYRCPANTQEGKCGDCRSCWNSEVSTVSYPLH